jgi:hypothetical protein
MALTILHRRKFLKDAGTGVSKGYFRRVTAKAAKERAIHTGARDMNLRNLAQVLTERAFYQIDAHNRHKPIGTQILVQLHAS